MGARDVALHVRVHGRSARSGGRQNVTDGGQRIHLRDRCFDGILRLVCGLSDDDREQFADVVDLVSIQDRPSPGLHVLRHPVGEAGRDLGQILSRPHREDAGHRFRDRRVDREDTRVGKGRAAEGDVDEPVELDVPCETTAAFDQSLVFDAAHAPADVWSHAPTISRPPLPYRRVPKGRGRLAQLEERQLDMLEVGGSRPSPPTIGLSTTGVSA